MNFNLQRSIKIWRNRLIALRANKQTLLVTYSKTRPSLWRTLKTCIIIFVRMSTRTKIRLPPFIAILSRLQGIWKSWLRNRENNLKANNRHPLKILKPATLILLNLKDLLSFMKAWMNFWTKSLWMLLLWTRSTSLLKLTKLSLKIS